MIYEKIRAERPDVIAFQEVTAANGDFLRHAIGDIYDMQLFARSANYDGEGLMIALLKDTFVFDGVDYFWLSPTPCVPGSRFEIQSPCPRIAVVVRARELKSCKIVRICNAHLDHKSHEARLLGMNLLLSRIEAMQKDFPLETVILGDMNAAPDSPAIRACLESPIGLYDLTKHLDATFHDYGRASAKIDYIFATKKISATAGVAKIWDDVHDGIYLSDHYPIEISFNLK